jgi:endonuclease YncB( thermonuclease family)
LLAALARPSSADVAGPASVIDGDTLVVAGERIRLEGIDAPELRQDCTAYGQQWACGRTSPEWLKEYLHGRQVECVGHARDRYRRLLAVCYVGGEDLNERLVREGWALNFRRYSTRLPARRVRGQA